MNLRRMTWRDEGLTVQLPRLVFVNIQISDHVGKPLLCIPAAEIVADELFFCWIEAKTYGQCVILHFFEILTPLKGQGYQ